MTTSTTNTSEPNVAPMPSSSFLPWISRALEALWLLAVCLVPLIFLGQEYAVSEAQIAYIEIPKVALLRTLAGLIALLWLSEWAITSRAFDGSFPYIPYRTFGRKSGPYKAVLAVINWLKVHPTRWLVLTAGLFFGSTVLSTAFSGSFTNSMWGEIPGQDGYAAYTVASYGILFAVIATHLKTKRQLSRLLGAIIVMGALVGLYGIFQYCGHDFLSLTETTGGGSARVTVFMGNAIFAAAVLCMTAPMTLVAAAVNFHDETWGGQGLLSQLGQLHKDYLQTCIWASILAIQLLGLIFTFSRGPWSAVVLAVVAFLCLLAISLGFRILVRTGLVLGLASLLSVTFLHWQGSVSIFNAGEWLSIVLALLGLVGTLVALLIIKRYGPAIVIIAAVGAVITIVVASALIPYVLSNRADFVPTGASAIGGSTADQVTGRIGSIKTDVLGGFVGGRGTHWKVSWTLIKDRPWFEFDDLSLSWIRPLIGYGPDLFRYTYLLKSPPEDLDLLPLEPDHAHNFFIHQTVEQGAIGGLASLALFASVFGVAGRAILFRRTTGNPVYQLVLIGLIAIVFGRFLEMMVGVARISDLTIFWVILGMFAAMINFDNGNVRKANYTANRIHKPISSPTGRRETRVSKAQTFRTGLIWRFAIVAFLAGGIGVLTWQKSINPVHASIVQGQAVERFMDGDLAGMVERLDKAIKLAPGVPHYYNNRAQASLAYQLEPGIFTESRCSQQTDVTYSVCLGIQSLTSNLEAANQQQFNYRAWVAAANSAFNLQLYNSAAESFAKASSMVPNSWIIRNDLAESQIGANLYKDALSELNQSLKITGESDGARSTRALYLKGKALKELGQLDEAQNALNQGLSLGYTSEVAADILAMWREINTELGVDLNIVYFDKKISQSPQDPVPYYFRGLAHLAFGNAGRAVIDIEKSYDLGLRLNDTLANMAYARLKNGDIAGSRTELASVVALAPQNPLYNAYYAEHLMSQGHLIRAFNYTEDATALAPNFGLPYLIRAEILLALDLYEYAKMTLSSSVEMGLPNAQDYVDRGEMRTFFAEYDLALSDLNTAIKINPNQPKYYNARAKTFALMGNFQSALQDLDTAIQKDPAGAEYFINRGVIYDILEKTKLSLADFEIAVTLDEVDIPIPNNRNTSYFAVYEDNTSEEAEARQFLKLQMDAKAQRSIESYSKVKPSHLNYQSVLLALGRTYLVLEFWWEAVTELSRLLELAPSSPEAFRYRGDAYLALKQFEDANNDYQQAVKLNASDSENFVARGNGYVKLGKYELALHDFTEAIRLDPNSSNAYTSRGNLSVETGNHSSAFSDLDHAIEIGPLNHDAYFKRAQAHAGLGRKSLALDDLAQAIKLAPTNSDYLYNRGVINLKSGEYHIAIEDFSGAIGLRKGFAYMDPRHIRPFVGRGTAYLRLGNPHLAVDDGNSAVQYMEDNFAVVTHPGRFDGWTSYRPVINRQLADAHELLSNAYFQIGKTEEALSQHRQAFNLRYKNP